MTNNESSSEEVPLRDRPIEEISDRLQHVLGQQLVAYAIREKDPAKIGEYASSEDAPDEEVQEELRNLADITEALLDAEEGSEETVRALVIGMNPLLNDQAVVELFHNGQSDRVIAAKSALTYGGMGAA